MAKEMLKTTILSYSSYKQKQKIEKNFNKLFKVLEKEFPGWISIEFINKKCGLSSIFESDLKRLHKEGFLDMEKFQNPEASQKKEMITKKMYRLSVRGFNFLNNLNSKEINKRLLWLTLLMILLIAVQIVLKFI